MLHDPDHDDDVADRLIEAERWLWFARDDAASAQLHVATTMILPHQACYHAQQAAEKALKAVHILRRTVFPKTHALMALSALLPPTVRHVVHDIDLATLTSWVTVARYPSDAEEPTVVQAAAAIFAADVIVQRVSDLFATSRSARIPAPNDVPAGHP